MEAAANTPIIVGVGQFTERLNAPDYRGLSAYEIAAMAARNAIDDALSVAKLGAHIDVIATTRTFEDSTQRRAMPFGKSNNFPRSVAKQLGINPAKAIWDKAGGDSPQRLVSEMFVRVGAGEFNMALVAGGENISSARHLIKEGKKVDWSDSVKGEVEDRGPGLKGMMSHNATRHRLIGGLFSYPLAENARRHKLKLDRKAYAYEMGRLFAPFSKVASVNPYSSAEQKEYTSEDLIAPSERNRMITDPYTQKLVARDQVNQGAAVLITTVGMARKLGIPEAKWVYLHGYSDMSERELMEREDFSVSPAAQMACNAALKAAGVTVDDMAVFDFYSCFPIAVFNAACDGLGISPDDKRGLTVTGGLPYFGGPGNNYSMHAIAEVVARLRAAPGTHGFVGANGGILSKYSAGVYSTCPRTWTECDSSALQADIDGRAAPTQSMLPEGAAFIETYTTAFEKGSPAYSIVVGRLEATNERFLANSQEGDAQTVAELLRGDPIGRRIFVTTTPHGNRFAFSQERLAELLPKRTPVLRDQYEHCIVERNGHLLEVTINRPEVRNCLHPMANDELDEIFDAFAADPNLWVAILTGAGSDAFSAGLDLKYQASGKPSWSPKTGFGGITNRVRTKPVIAAVNGIAMGGGTEMALACDIVVADEKAQFALSEVRVGVMAGAGGLVRLPRQIPKKIATEYILTGRKMPVAMAHQYGLVNRIVPAGKALDGAREIAAEILEVSPTSVRLSMQVMNDADMHASEIGAHRNRDPKILDDLFNSEDFLEGPAAFAQKRKPIWKNR